MYFLVKMSPLHEDKTGPQIVFDDPTKNKPPRISLPFVSYDRAMGCAHAFELTMFQDVVIEVQVVGSLLQQCVYRSVNGVSQAL
jgi:hypothetical protein